jgi:hypothetical protein
MAAGTAQRHRYRPTESKYKGGAAELHVTYDLKQRTRGGSSALYPKVKRVYIAGNVMNVSVGRVRKRTGREVRGVRIEYEQSRKGYRRAKFAARRGGRAYSVRAASVEPTRQRFAQVIELPDRAQNVKFYPTRARLPVKYRHALQRIR